jgi:hypothetical protein
LRIWIVPFGGRAFQSAQVAIWGALILLPTVPRCAPAMGGDGDPGRADRADGEAGP